MVPAKRSPPIYLAQLAPLRAWIHRWNFHTAPGPFIWSPEKTFWPHRLTRRLNASFFVSWPNSCSCSCRKPRVSRNWSSDSLSKFLFARLQREFFVCQPISWPNLWHSPRKARISDWWEFVSNYRGMIPVLSDTLRRLKHQTGLY